MALNGKIDKFAFPRRSSTFNLPTTAKRLNPEGINFSSDVQSDIILNVDGVTFSLHKFPLMTRSGRIRRLVGEELKEADSIMSPPVIEFSNFPGGPDIFELAAKFCYGINFEITTAKVACLRCAAEFLEMTDDYGEENLIGRTEAFLTEVVFKSLDKSAEVLHSCEVIMSLAEEVRMVNRCIDVVASKVCSEQQELCSLFRMEGNNSGRWKDDNHNAATASHWNHDSDATPHQPSSSIKAKVEWWAEYLSPLRIDLYQRVFAAMKASGLRSESLGGSLMHYAHTSLKGLANQSTKQNNVSVAAGAAGTATPTTTAIRFKTKHHLDMSFGNSPKSMQQQEQRILVETIVSLLPIEKNTFSTNFLLSLLRNAIILDTTVACRLDLERRVGLQLEQATVDDLLIPALSPHAGDAMFDVDVVYRVLTTYLQQEEKVNHEHFSLASDIDDLTGSPSSQKGITKVAKVMDMYLAEIAPDPNLKASKFASLAEQLPSYARVLDDGLYRAIDIFLKAHPTLSDMERRKMCKVLDCQKLSKEACIHAAQNERLPVQMVVQVLYFEQIRMRNAMGGGDDHPFYHQEAGPGSAFASRHLFKTSSIISPRLDTYSSLRRENRELKEEVASLQLRVAELQKENVALKGDIEKSAGTNGNSGRFFSSVSRRLGKMNPFSSKPKETMKQTETRITPRRRRHSVS